VESTAKISITPKQYILDNLELEEEKDSKPKSKVQLPDLKFSVNQCDIHLLIDGIDEYENKILTVIFPNDFRIAKKLLFLKKELKNPVVIAEKDPADPNSAKKSETIGKNDLVPTDRSASHLHFVKIHTTPNMTYPSSHIHYEITKELLDVKYLQEVQIIIEKLLKN